MDEANVVLEIGSPLKDGAVKEDKKIIIVHSIIDHREAKMDDELESTRVEMGKVKEENELLKTKLNQMKNDYQILKMRYTDTIQHESNKKLKDNNNNSSSLSSSPTCTRAENNEESEDNHDELVSLSLGRKRKNSASISELQINKNYEKTQSEVSKTTNNDEFSQEQLVKKPRVSVRARCDTPTMNDGCQWRKYGQKISKGNPCPRAYYRCTVAPVCPVRKQVQRCAQDMSILITTYEGTHNHPLPLSATAMASTTSAAASMLLSGSSTTTTTTQSLNTSPMTNHNHNNNLNGLLNFNQFDNSKNQQFYIPNSSSTSLAFPTITLDLTTNPSSNLFNQLSSTSNLNFSSESNILPSFWNNNHSTAYNNTQLGQSFQLNTHTQNDQVGYSQDPPQQMLTETLTTAITSDPGFRTVIAAAISSMATGGNVGTNYLKWGEQISMANSTSSNNNNNALSTSNNVRCASSYLDRTSSLNSQKGSLKLMQPSFPFSILKGNVAAATQAPVHDKVELD